MRTRVILWCVVALLAACSRQPVERGPLTLTAVADTEVKSSLSGTTVHWSAEDDVAAFVDNVRHVSTGTSITGNTATFTFSDLDKEAIVQYAVYPAAAAVEMTDKGQKVKLTVPTEQIAVAGSFAQGACVSLAQGGSSPLVFKNVCGFLSFTLNADNVQDVRIWANEPMTGTAVVDYNGGSLLTTPDAVSAFTGVLLKGPFTSGNTYYAAVLPGTYTGLTLKLTHENGYISTYTNPNTLVVNRNDNLVIANNLALRSVTPGTWFEKDPYTIGATEPVIIVGKTNGVYRTIDNTANEDYPDASGTATVTGSTVTDPGGQYKWNIAYDSETKDFVLYPAESTTRWLYFANDSDDGNQDGLYLGDNTYYPRKYFQWDAAGHIVTHDSHTPRYLFFREESSKWYWRAESYPAYVGDDNPTAAFSFYVQVP